MIKLVIDKESSIPVYRQIFDQFEKAILSNKLVPNTKLPSIRSLSIDLGVNKDTIVHAYKILEEKKYLNKIKGKGTFVFNPMVEDEFVANESKDYEYDLSKPSIEDDLFPVDAFSLALNAVLKKDKGKAFDYHEQIGFLPLRKEIKEMLMKQGIEANLENIIIVTGAHQGIDIVSRAIEIYRKPVFIENPTYQSAFNYFKSTGAKMISFQMKKDGIDIDRVYHELTFNKPALMYLMPNFQNPTTWSYSLEKKQLILDVAKETKGFIIEDDYTNDLYFDNVPKTLFSLDKERDTVVYIKSFSKVLMPGLRVSFIVVPDRILTEVLNSKSLTDAATSGILQRATAEFIGSGDLEDYMTEMRNYMKNKVALTCRYLDMYMPEGTSYNKPEGGFNFWIKLPKGVNSKTLLDLTMRDGLIFRIGEEFNAPRKSNDYIRISVGSIASDNLEDAIKILAKGINSCVYRNKIVIKK